MPKKIATMGMAGLCVGKRNGARVVGGDGSGMDLLVSNLEVYGPVTVIPVRNTKERSR